MLSLSATHRQDREGVRGLRALHIFSGLYNAEANEEARIFLGVRAAQAVLIGLSGCHQLL